VPNSPDRRKTEALRDSIATAEALFSLGQSEAQAIASGIVGDERKAFAQALCSKVLDAYWRAVLQASAPRLRWEIQEPRVKRSTGFSGLGSRLAGALASLSKPRAGYLLGQLYTALLPEEIRKSLGAYYTPPPLVERLLANVEESGCDWAQARVIDPACGGAAFLSSVAPRLAHASRHRTAHGVLADVEERLVGVELDEFAAWISSVLLEIALLDVVVAAGRRLRPTIYCRDALDLTAEEIGAFDLVIGNPPYGKVRLTNEKRAAYQESLYGHANLYGLFTHLAVRLTKPHGLIAFVTPTSVLGGEYFKNLRSLLGREAPLASIDFVTNREGVFDSVLQETMLTTFRKVSKGNGKTRAISVAVLHVNEPAEPVEAEPLGRMSIAQANGAPWLLPRAREHVPIVRCFDALPHRLADYEFAVSTGQLVWNRHKAQLRATCGDDCLPIIWAEAVNPDGTFHFQAARSTHLPYLAVQSGQDFLINHEPCILLQRTTAKEQQRRLIAAVIPNSFIVEYPGFVVENHLNMIYPLRRKPAVALRTIATLLNSATVDLAFRCINGSVAVSAYELNALPLPNPDQMQQLQAALIAGEAPREIESLISSFYSPRHERNGHPASAHSLPDDRRVAA
jgi:adenine-specific DNA-methyltransferase